VKNLFIKNYILILILIVGLFLRIWSLENIPPSMHVDEAEAAYGAYSILLTGNDHYGNFMPIQFQENHRMPLVVYVLIPFVNYLGLNPFAERLPFAILGVLTLIIIYFLAEKLFKNRIISLVSTFLLAFNPWSIHLSRTGLEQSLCLFLVILGITLFLYSEKRTKILLIISALTLGISLYSYHAPKIFLTLFLPILFYFKKSFIKKNKKNFLIFLAIFGIFYIFSLKLTFIDGISKFKDTSIFDSARATNVVNSERHLTTAPLWVSSIFHNKPLYYIKMFSTTYVGFFSINYMFLNGEGNLDKGTANTGQYYLFELPFFFLGLYYLFRKDKKMFTFLLLWLLFAAVPGGLTNTGYYAYRDLLIIPVPILFTSLGIFFVYGKIKKLNKYKTITLFVSSIVCFVFIINYLFTYFCDYPVYSSDWWQFPQKEAIKYITQNNKQYDKVIVSGGSDWPVLYAFYNKVNPRNFQEAFNNKVKIGNKIAQKFDNIYFGDFASDHKEYLNLSREGEKILFVNFTKNFTDNNPIKLIKSPNEVNIVVRIYEKN